MNKRTVDITLIGIFVAILTISAYIHIPFSGVSFTLQTFALYLCLFCLGTRRALVALLIYILMGLSGLPVFSGFLGGAGVIFGLSGGFILAFPISLLLSSLIIKAIGKSFKGYFISALCSLPLCHLIGTVWFCYIYFGALSLSGIFSSFAICSLPFLLPDALKAFFASLLGVRINKILRSF